MRSCVRAILAAALLGLALGGASGCFVFDELDSGMEKIERSSTRKKTEPAPSPTPAASDEDGGGGGLAGAADALRRSLWEGGRSLNPHEKSAEIARCELGGGVQFMTRDDCLARGGRPG